MYRTSYNYWQHVVTYRVVSDNFILFVHITHTEQLVRILASGRDKKYTYVMYICYLVTKMSLFILPITLSVFCLTQNLSLQFFNFSLMSIQILCLKVQFIISYYFIGLSIQRQQNFLDNLQHNFSNTDQIFWSYGAFKNT